ncbi:MAG: hypothetical protein M3179_12125 [Actinomycetota bacterium]|nr:hypothetical protein [Actinomycetota bacterium]
MLFARGAEKRLRQRPPGETSDRFRCSRCASPIQLEQVLTADLERRGSGVTGYVVFRHSCTCTPVGTRATRSWATHAAFCALFGRQPWLPYRTPFRLVPVDDEHPALGRWRWELGQVADSREFLLFLDDAQSD